MDVRHRAGYEHGSARPLVGIDLGGTHCRIVIADGDGLPVRRVSHRTPAETSAQELARWLAERVAALSAGMGARVGAPMRDPALLAIGVPGPVSADQRSIAVCQNLPQIVGDGFVRALEEPSGCPVVLHNDSDLALLGELRLGSLDRAATSVLLVLGTGLGSSVAIDGRVLQARRGALGEFGRLHVPREHDPRGEPIRLRDLLSGAGLVEHARRLGHELSSAATIFGPSPEFGGLRAEIGQALRWLVSIVTIAYEPDAVLLTGGFADSLDAADLAALAECVAAETGVRVSIGRPRLGRAAGLLGALSSAIDTAFGSDAARDDIDWPLVLRRFRQLDGGDEPGGADSAERECPNEGGGERLS